MLRRGADILHGRTSSVHCRMMVALFVLLVLLSLSAFQSEPGAAKLSPAAAAQAQDKQNSIVLFDADWPFDLGGAQGAEQHDFDDANWRRLDLPHDWRL